MDRAYQGGILNMRVITGFAKGRKLNTPAGTDTRPTSDMVKESIFSIVQNDIESAYVLDLFAGSGQLGIEALSRGAKFVVFVDSSRDAQETIRNNLQHVQLAPNSRVVAMDYLSFLSSTKDIFDIVFIDPPYTNGMIDKALPLVAEKMSEIGIIVCESDLKDNLPELVGEFTRKREYCYGRKKITTYRKEQQQ